MFTRRGKKRSLDTLKVVIIYPNKLYVEWKICIGCELFNNNRLLDTGHSGSKALDLYAYRVSYNRYILFNECSIPFNPPVTGI